MELKPIQKKIITALERTGLLSRPELTKIISRSLPTIRKYILLLVAKNRVKNSRGISHGSTEFISVERPRSAMNGAVKTFTIQCLYLNGSKNYEND